jgi:tyramine---L-glutamate ligase
MMAALVTDLLEVPGVHVSFARDDRLALPDGSLLGARVLWRTSRTPPVEALAREVDSSDAVWPIAPETGGELERIARAVQSAGRVLLGPDPDAIGLAGSKFATAQRLAQAGIDAVPCFRPGSPWPAIDGPWVVKPDDGAGSLGLRVFRSRDEAAGAAEREHNLIAQPWIDGEAMSLCVLAAPAAVVVLSVNRQLLRIDHGKVELTGIEVNCQPVTAALASLAERVAAAIPGLRGYFGIDWVQTAAGPRVIEINPRLTTSYAGLKPALGVNVAEWVLAAGMDRPCAGGSCERERRQPGRAVKLMLNGHANE